MNQISLKAARVNAELTQLEAAKRLGVCKSTIMNWESGKSSPTADNLKALCEVYQMPYDCIFLPERLAKS